jgi:hypothetical protein
MSSLTKGSFSKLHVQKEGQPVDITVIRKEIILWAGDGKK